MSCTKLSNPDALLPMQPFSKSLLRSASRVLPIASDVDARLDGIMEIKVFATEDGALVLLPLDTGVSDHLLKIGALRPIGEGCVPDASLSPELVSLLAAGSPAMAQPPDVEPVLRAVAMRALS